MENAHFDALLQQKKGKGMKRPAASNASTAAVGKHPASTAAMGPAKKPATKCAASKAAAKKSATPVTKLHAKKPKHGGPYGCVRCRGNKQGCSSCWQPNFAGVRLPSREEWRAYMKANGKKV